MSYRTIMTRADQIIAGILFLTNVGCMISAEIYNPVLLVAVSAPALLHAWRNGIVRILFSAIVFVEGWFLYVACDIQNGPENRYLHPMHDLTFLIALYGLATSIWIFVEKREPTPEVIPEQVPSPSNYYRGK